MRPRGSADFRPTVLPLATPPGAPARGPRVLWWVAAFAAASGLLLALALWFLHAQAVRSGEQLARALAHVIAEQTTRSVQAVEQRLHRAAQDLMGLQ